MRADDDGLECVEESALIASAAYANFDVGFALARLFAYVGKKRARLIIQCLYGIVSVFNV